MNGFQIHARTRAVAPDLAERFRRIPVANISDCMSRMTAGGPRLRPMHGGAVMAGPALTVRTRPGDNLLVHKALDLAQPGDVIVVDAGGDLTNAIIGEIMTSYARSRGVAGIVINGAIRDCGAIRQGDFPVYAAGVTHRGPYKDGPGEINGTIALDGMTIAPGDLILGDDDGVLAIPFDQVETLYQAAQASTRSRNECWPTSPPARWTPRGSTRASGSSAARGLTMTAPARHAFTVARLDLWIDPVFDAAIQDDAALRVWRPPPGTRARPRAWRRRGPITSAPPGMKCRVAGRSRLTCSRPVRDCCACPPAARATTRSMWRPARRQAWPWSTRPAPTRPRSRK